VIEVSSHPIRQIYTLIYGIPVSQNARSSIFGLFTGSKRLCGSSWLSLFATFDPVCFAFGQCVVPTHRSKASFLRTRSS
jgi:hypothetical protein